MNTKERHMNKKREGLGLDNKRRETHESRYLFRERHMTRRSTCVYSPQKIKRERHMTRRSTCVYSAFMLGKVFFLLVMQVSG